MLLDKNIIKYYASGIRNKFKNITLNAYTMTQGKLDEMKQFHGDLQLHPDNAPKRQTNLNEELEKEISTGIQLVYTHYMM